MNFKALTFPAFLLTAATAMAAGDFVTLKDGNTITGKILSLTEETIEVTSPHSPAPLKIIGTQLRNLSFENSVTSNLPSHSQKITLSNGDVFPGEVISLNDEVLKLETWFAGPLEVKRSLVKSLHLGVKPQELIYDGPRDISDWRHEGAWRNGNINGESNIHSAGSGTMSRQLNLPESFIFQTQIRWTAQPNLRIILAADDFRMRKVRNAYQISLNNQGLQIERLDSQKKADERVAFLGDLRTKPEEFDQNTALLELRVNRPERLIHLYLDGELRKTFRDQSKAPDGGHVIFDSRINSAAAHHIDALKIFRWDTLTHRLHREGPVADTTLDTVSIQDGDRYGGDIKLISDGNLTLKTTHLENTISIPLKDCSVLHFSSENGATNEAGTLKLSLAGGGSLGLRSVNLGDQLEANHPLLGTLSLDRRILSQIIRSSKATSKK